MSDMDGVIDDEEETDEYEDIDTNEDDDFVSES